MLISRLICPIPNLTGMNCELYGAGLNDQLAKIVSLPHVFLNELQADPHTPPHISTPK